MVKREADSVPAAQARRMDGGWEETGYCPADARAMPCGQSRGSLDSCGSGDTMILLQWRAICFSSSVGTT